MKDVMPKIQNMLGWVMMTLVRKKDGAKNIKIVSVNERIVDKNLTILHSKKNYGDNSDRELD